MILWQRQHDKCSSSSCYVPPPLLVLVIYSFNLSVPYSIRVATWWKEQPLFLPGSICWLMFFLVPSSFGANFFRSRFLLVGLGFLDFGSFRISSKLLVALGFRLGLPMRSMGGT